MKKLLAAMFVALLMVGCGGPDFGGSLSDGVGGIIGGMVMAFFLLVVIGVAVTLIIGGIVGGVVASKRKKGVWKGVGVGVGCGFLLVVVVIGGCVSYEQINYKLEQRREAEKEAKIWAKKIGLDDHRIILDAVDISSLWPHEGREVPSRDYTGWVKTMTDNYKGHIGRIEMLAQLKDGLFITIAVWKPNGEKCPATNVKKGNGVRVWYKDDGTEGGRWIYKDGKVVSRTSYHSNGQKKEEATYKDGEMDGLETGWYMDGQKDAEVNYKNGKKEGLATEWYMNGQKDAEVNYKNGKKEGLATEWYMNGQKEEEGIFKDDEKHGLHTSWHMKGRKEVWIYNGARISIKDPTKKPAEPVFATGPVKGVSYTILGLKLDMRWCKSGTFPRSGQHEVTLTQGFYLGKHEVTQLQWEKVMGTNPSGFKGATLPVENVSWYDAMEFCVKLTQMEKAAGRLPEGHVYTLPTEAQWEYACRAGTTTAYSFGNTITHKQANFYRKKWKKNKSTNRFERPVGKTTAIGTYPANAWGFHDMHGNVLEWCSDRTPWQSGDPSGSATDPVGSFGGHQRVHRGGSWREGGGSGLRSAQRSSLSWNARNSWSGFRLSLQPEMKWLETGQKRWERTYKDGKIWTAVGWKPNGEKCPATNVVDGNGVWVDYNEDGTEKRRHTYKDGELVED